MLKVLRFCVAATLLALAAGMPANADIRAFNEKVKVKDYKGAAAEAVSTWQTLDKSRPDITVIAREFGFAAYMGGDYAGAQTFAKFATDNEPAGVAAEKMRATSTTLLRLAEYRQSPARQSRDALWMAVQARLAAPGVDIISYLAMEAVVAQDFRDGKWAEAERAASAASSATERADPSFLTNSRRFKLYTEVAGFMQGFRKERYTQLASLRKKVLADFNSTPDETNIQQIIDLYWEVYAWESAVGQHLESMRRMRMPDDGTGPFLNDEPTEREMRLLGAQKDKKRCQTKLSDIKKPDYPKSALYAGTIGTVVISIDIDATGKASNAKVLAAAPEKHFGNAVLGSAETIRYTKGDAWEPSCSLEQKGKVLTFFFALG